jgi:hypothetical protein
VPHFIIALGFVTLEDVPVRTVWSKPQDMLKGSYEVIFREESVFLSSGRYKVVIGLSSREQTFQFIDDKIYCEFEEYVDKTVALRSSQQNGLILNQMQIVISELKVV